LLLERDTVEAEDIRRCFNWTDGRAESVTRVSA